MWTPWGTFCGKPRPLSRKVLEDGGGPKALRRGLGPRIGVSCNGKREAFLYWEEGPVGQDPDPWTPHSTSEDCKEALTPALGH